MNSIENTIKELESEFRKYKIKGILTDNFIQPDARYISKEDYLVAKEISKYGIITGSFVLRLYGLIPRQPADFDIIVTQEIVKQLSAKGGLRGHGYSDDFGLEGTSIGYVKYRTQTGRVIKLDLFQSDKDLPSVNFDGITLDICQSVLHEKSKLLRSSLRRNKDYLDFLSVIDRIKNNTVYPFYKKEGNMVSRFLTMLQAKLFSATTSHTGPR